MAIPLSGMEKVTKEFLKGFSGVCVTDGYQAYHSLEEKTPGLTIAGCCAHARCKYAEALKAMHEVLPKSQTRKAFTYSINQEQYLRVFLEDGEVPLDNNATESTLRGFCIGKHNWRLIDTVRGAKSSAIIYSITETAKANGLKVYDYVEHLLTEIPKHEDDTDLSFLDNLLPWSPNLPGHCRKSNKYEVK